jgi:single-stranded-DNA-specific exonuclease
MDKGVARLVEAVGRGERICIWGDYDADGISCLALMFNFLTHLGVVPVIHIPTREEGYGLHVDEVEDLAKEGVDLIVCLDCGSSCAEIACPQLGVDTIVIYPTRWARGPPAAPR